jgi:hypothetical protein
VTSSKAIIQSYSHHPLCENPMFCKTHTKKLKTKGFASYLGNKQVYVQKIKPSYENLRCLAHSSKHKTFARLEAL